MAPPLDNPAPRRDLSPALATVPRHGQLPSSSGNALTIEGTDADGAAIKITGVTAITPAGDGYCQTDTDVLLKV